MAFWMVAMDNWPWLRIVVAMVNVRNQVAMDNGHRIKIAVAMVKDRNQQVGTG